MTPEERAAARARCELATPGPWQNDNDRLAVWADVGSNWIADCSDSFCPQNDGAFIAHARVDLPAALDALDVTDKRVEELERTLAHTIKEAGAEYARMLRLFGGTLPG